MISSTDIEDMTDAQDEASQWQHSQADLRLLSCPFCGNNGSGPIEDALHVSQVIVDDENGYDERYAVQCDKCTATMGSSETADEAVDAWNTRADLARPSQAGDERVAECIAIALWRAEAAVGTPSVQKRRNADTWADQAPELRDRWMRFARAALAAMDTPKGGGE